MSKKIPAVTSVEEWTNALTGVGAAMAAGSQDLKGYWALFVNAPTTKMKRASSLISLTPIQEVPAKAKDIKRKIRRQSPIRLISSVVNPLSSLSFD